MAIVSKVVAKKIGKRKERYLTMRKYNSKLLIQNYFQLR